MCSKFLFFTKLVAMGLNHSSHDLWSVTMGMISSNGCADVTILPVATILLFNRMIAP
jgi:hypothetical protein